MKFWKDKKSSQSQISFNHLWWIPALVPLFIIIYSFMTGTWFWGLMDDHRMVMTPGSVGERFTSLYQSLFIAGRFFPTFILHLAFFYKIFADNPLAFFIFRFLETILALSLWGYFGYVVTKKKIVIPIFFAVTLSFLKFYDAFFFLSTQEILGVLFSGASALCICQALQPHVINPKKFNWMLFISGWMFLLLAFTSKEPFVAVGAAMGMSLMLEWLHNRKRTSMLYAGFFLFVFSAGYAVVLKMFVTKGYSASYSIGWDKISVNLTTWFKVVFMNHLPWIVILVFSCFFRNKRESDGVNCRWALYFLIAAYIAYLVIILPWNGGGHYVTPLGVFFGLGLALFFVYKVEVMRTWIVGIIIALSLSLNFYYGGKAIHFHVSYQYDTVHLLEWISQNTLFRHEVMTKKGQVRCNANEPCTAIRNLARDFYESEFQPFYFTSSVKEVLKDRNTRYYIYSPFWGDQDFRRLPEMWTPVFVSEHWIVFRRMVG